MQTSERRAGPLGPAPTPLPLLGGSEVPESLGYRIKNRLLGSPLTTEQLGEQRLSKFAALGVLSPDCISSTAYGSEEILRILVPAVGVAAFSLLLPVTAAVIVVLFFVTLSYREVVMAYTKTGGAYMVSRENFGPKIAQIAASALILDYCLTVAVQVAAGTDAVLSAVPSLDHIPDRVVTISIVVVLLMFYANLRGIREASKVFVAPTYLFIVTMVVMVVAGLVEAALGDLHRHSIAVRGAVGAGHPGSGLLLGASVFVLLKSFANGGSSLTGLEAISNGVSAFKPPTGNNARRTLVVMSVTLGSLVCGVSLLAHITHAVPYVSGTPTVVAQEADYVFGHGSVLYYLIIAANVAILWTGGNTSFSGFPFLTSFVAADSFLPRWLSKRGHRLAFSNGIIVLTVVGIVLLVGTGANLDSLVSLYAIGVFTGFTMAGAGMVRYHRRNRTKGWRHRSVINGFAAVLTASVVVIFAVTKFTSGAWLIVVLLPVLVLWFIRINHRYRQEEAVLEAGVRRIGGGKIADAPMLRRHVVVVLVDRLDLATIAAIRYGRSLVPDQLRVVNFRTDPLQTRQLEDGWRERGMSNLALEVLDCPDRRIGRATLDTLAPYLDGETQVSVLLPRRDFSGFAARVLHDRTADRISLLLSEVRNVNAIIVPFQLSEAGASRRLAMAAARRARAESPEAQAGPKGKAPDRDKRGAKAPAAGPSVPGRMPIADLEFRRRAKVAGMIKSVEIQPRDGIQVLTARLEDETGGINLVFGRGRVDGIEASAKVVAEGMVGEYEGCMCIRNPDVEFLARAHEGE